MGWVWGRWSHSPSTHRQVWSKGSGDVCDLPYPKGSPLQEQWGTPGRRGRVPRVPGSARARAQPSAKPGMLDGPCLSTAPWAGQPLAVGRGQFGSEQWKMVCGLLLNSMCCWGDKGRAPGKSQQHSGQEEPWGLPPSQGCVNVEQCGASPVPEPAHRAGGV